MTDENPPPSLPGYDLSVGESQDCARRHLNSLISTSAYEAGVGVALHRPTDVFMQIASGCNLDCYMCSEHNRPEEWRHGRGLKSMPPELFAKIERDVLPYANQVTIGVGGEPTISKHFVEYLRRVHAAGPRVHVMSNGTRLNTAERAGALAECASSVEISIDGATPETYERIRLGSKWGKLIENLQRFGRHRAALPEGERAHLTLCFVLMKSNVHEFPLFVDLGKALGADRVSGWHLIPVTPEGHEESLQEEKARSNAYLEAAKKRGEQLGIEVDVPELFPLPAGTELPEVELPELDPNVPYQFVHGLVPDPAKNEAAQSDTTDDFEYADEETHASIVDAQEAETAMSAELNDAPITAAMEDRALTREASTNSGVPREAIRTNRAGGGKIHCSSPTTSMFVFFDGRVFPCCHPHAHAALPMGNLLDQEFADIWNNDLYRNLREGLATGDAPPLCQSCSIVHSPPPKLEAQEELVTKRTSAAQYYGDRKPATSVEDAREFVDDLLAERWRSTHATMSELVRTREEAVEAHDKAAEMVAKLQAEKAELEAQVRGSGGAPGDAEAPRKRGLLSRFR